MSTTDELLANAQIYVYDVHTGAPREATSRPTQASPVDCWSVCCACSPLR
jgi:hypothetical protein